MKKSRMYIAGPMRGIKLYNFPAFDRARDGWSGWDVVSPADIDREHGFDPVNLPADHDWNTLPEGFDLISCAKRDLDALLTCDAIYMLEGWKESAGARAEPAVAEWLGLDPIYENIMEGDPSALAAQMKRLLEEDREDGYTDESIQRERQSVYGDFTRNMIGTSQQLSGLLTQMYANGQLTISDGGRVELPDWAAPLFMSVALKGNRIASGKYHADNYADLRIYLNQTEAMQHG